MPEMTLDVIFIGFFNVTFKPPSALHPPNPPLVRGDFRNERGAITEQSPNSNLMGISG
jgi:hypothetical protein